MARIRSIHPTLFTDEAFVGVSMAARVLLLGLWTEADDQGIFDWKPVTLKMRLMPVDNVNIPDLLQELESHEIIRRFTQDARELGAIRNFCKFQRPKTPKYRLLKSVDIRNYVASTYQMAEDTHDEVEPFPQKVEMAPQMEEGGDRREDEVKEESIPTPAKPQARANDAFDRFKAAYPRRDGANPWHTAEKKFNALVKTGVDAELMIRAASDLAREEHTRGNAGTKFIPQAITWLNQQRFADYAAAALSISEFKGYYAKPESQQLEAWDRHNLSVRGKRLPRDRNGGWRVDAEWPPGYSQPRSNSSSHDLPPVALRAMQ